MTKTLKIKEQALLIKSVNHELIEQQKLTIPPTLNSVEEAFGLGVLITLISCKDLMYGIPLNAVLQEVMTKDDLIEFVKELGLEEQFKSFV